MYALPLLRVFQCAQAHFLALILFISQLFSLSFVCFFYFPSEHSMSNIPNTLKRTYNFLNEDELDDLNPIHQIKRKQNAKVLQDSNSLGILSPPTSPETGGKNIVLQNNTIKSASKNLNQNLSKLTEKAKVSPYTEAKNLFLRSSNPFSHNLYELSGREKEAEVIRSCLLNSLKTLQSSSIYVSGPPGTGKSAQINASINKIISSGSLIDSKRSIYQIRDIDGCMIDRKIRIIKFNCMSLSNPTELFKEMFHEITGKSYNTNVGSSQLLKLFIKTKPEDCDLTILVLDELDNIIQKSQQLLFELFTWTSEAFGNTNKPSLMFIGIANALNLTDRFLPRLRANCISPQLIQFLPYTADQIKQVLTNKLFSLISHNDKENTTTPPAVKFPPLVHPAAIQFCAKKAAVISGDLRRALDVMYKSIDLFEQTVLKSQNVEDLNNTPLENLPKVMISQVVKICSNCFNANFDLKLKPLNLQQNMILAFLFKFEEKIEVERSKKTKLKSLKLQEITLNSFFEYYVEMCKNFDHLNSLKRAEFLEVITSLDIHGLLVLNMVGITSNTKSIISRSVALINFDSYKVTSNIPKSEFFKHINDITLLKRIVYSNY